MEYLSARVRSLVPSPTIATNARARELISRGADILDLTVGEPDFPTPEPIGTEAKRAVDEGWTRYTPVAGMLELRQAIARKLARENGLAYAASNIVVGNGAKHALANAILALIGPGDEALIPAPYWVTYGELVRLAGGVPVFVPTRAEDGYKLQAADLERALGPRTKLLVLCTPCNPTGAVYGARELEALASVLVRHPRAWLLSDEVYEHLRYGGAHASPAAIPSIAERTVLVNGVSKAYAMTGWRIGYLAAPERLAKACADLQGQMTTNACSIAQRAAIAALDAGTGIIQPMLAAYRLRRDLVCKALGAMDGIALVEPQGAFYVFPDVSAYYGRRVGERRIGGSADFSSWLLERAGVAVVPGIAFGEDRCVRLSFACAEGTLERACARIGAALRTLPPP